MPSSTHTLARWVADRAALSPQAIAIDDGGVTVTYGALSARIDALASRLLAAGYGVGDRIASVSGNTADQIVLFFACAQTGLVFVPLSWRLTAIELADLLTQTDAVLIAVEEEHRATATHARSISAVTAPVVALGTNGIEAELPARASLGVQRPVADDDALLVIFTSGSESRPKGVILTHANCFWTNLSLASAAQLTEHDVVLCVLPQFHVAAWNCQPLLALWRGATLVLERSFQPGRVLQLIAERRITAMMGVPTHYRMLADDPAFASTPLDSIRHALVGGATMAADVSADWASRGVQLMQGYGLTEASPNVAHAAPGTVGSIGRPYAHVEIAIADPNTALELAGAVTGELWVRGPNVFPGYLANPDATAHAMVGDWLRTGDIVSRAEDGTLTVVDRLKDIYISGGENVAPAEVEAALQTHPNIVRAAVVGVPDAVWGERGVAFIVARVPMSADEVLAHARTRLAGFKVPVRIEFLAELPTSSIEKIARAELRERARVLVEASL